MRNKEEVWLRGPVPNMSGLLQPVAHALLQAREEVQQYVQDFPNDLLDERPASLASVRFHLEHLRGVLDRLFTYAQGKSLSDEQRTYLEQEGSGTDSVTTLVGAFNDQVEQAIAQLRITDEATLTDPRGVGRQQLPSTVLGLLTHAAEHTQRHVGQLLVTIRILQQSEQ